MERRQTTYLIQIAAYLFQGGDRRLVSGRQETDGATKLRLPQPPQIGLDDGPDLGVTARWLRVAQLDDRLTVGRHLNDARNDTV